MAITEASPSHRRLSFCCTVNEELSASVPRLAYVELYYAVSEYYFRITCLVASELCMTKLRTRQTSQITIV